VPDADASDVGDRAIRTRFELSDVNAEVTGSGHE
jgi:hypothetical protein